MVGLAAASCSFATAIVGRGDVRIAEAEVDHVAPVAPQLALQLVDRREDVRRQGSMRRYLILHGTLSASLQFL